MQESRGLLISVRVTAGSRTQRVEKAAGKKGATASASGPQRWKISVREPAEDNRANQRVRELIAAEYGITLSAVRIVKGHHSPSKLLAIQRT